MGRGVQFLELQRFLEEVLEHEITLNPEGLQRVVAQVTAQRAGAAPDRRRRRCRAGEAWGAQDSQPLAHKVTTSVSFERVEIGDAVVRRLAARAPSQATRGHSPRVYAALAHGCGKDQRRTAAATCVEVRAEL